MIPPSPGGRPVVGRLAPSPTGGLHVGHARTFLIAWLSARERGGKVVLRLEDIDSGRVRPEALDGIVEDLGWLGLDWDEGPIRQSGRRSFYEEALGQLRRRELVYPCTCTRAEILSAASAPHAGEEGPVYPGTCAGRVAADAIALTEQGRPFAWRFRVPTGEVRWADAIRGECAIDPARHGGDFVVGRSSGEPAYQLAVVVDDAAMGITQVVRGDDLLTSTPRQILLFRALELPAPEFAHVPLTIDLDGKRLAKRDGSIKLATLREGGIDPRALVGWLAMSCGWSGQIEPSSPQDWIGKFGWDSIPREPFRASPDRVPPPAPR